MILNGARRIDIGTDNTVYEKGNKVITVNSGISFEQVKEYQGVVNGAKEIFDGKEYETPFGKLKLIINKIEAVGESEQDVFRISDKIEGENIQTRLNKGEISAEDFNNYSGVLNIISRELLDVKLPTTGKMGETKFRGIHIIPYNTIISDGNLIVTDICPSIKNLKALAY